MRFTASAGTASATKLLVSMLLVCAGAWSASSAIAQTNRQIHLEVAAGRMEPVATQQKWMELLSKVGADRIRSSTARSAGKVGIEERETSLGVVVKVRGVIQGKKLELPAGSFSQRDVEKIRRYIDALRLDGVETALADKKAFGLTSKQLVTLNQSLSKPLKLKTKGNDPLKLIQFAKTKVNYEIVLDRNARAALASGGELLDELNGLSLGTALAATLRPYGLVLQPVRDQGQDIRLLVSDSRQAEEFWPIGWPAQGIPKDAAPGLFQKNLLEIRDFPLDQVLSAIQSKAGLPMLFDYNSMARREIDLATTKVTFVKKNVSYGHSLRKLLSKTKPPMHYEIRVDEAGKPFLWISTVAPVR